MRNKVTNDNNMATSLSIVAKSNKACVTFSNVETVTKVSFGLTHNNKNNIGSLKTFGDTYSNISRTNNTCSSIITIYTNKKKTLDPGDRPEYYRKEKEKRV